MRINLETDYAIRIVHCLSQTAERLDAAEISARTGVTPRFALKILRKLVGAGIIRSFKGAKGGYLLAREPEHINLKEVMEITDGPIAIGRCQNNGYTCDHPDEKACYFNHIFEEITQELAARLEAVTFASNQQ